MFLTATPAAHAHLVVLADGAFLEVDAWEVTGEKVRLELPAGGMMVLPLLRVERIVEVEPKVVAVEPPPAPPSFPWSFDPASVAPKVPHGELIYAAAQRHGLNPHLLATVVWAESGYQPRAVSSKGARGLMQLMPATARRFGLEGERIYDPASNLDAGARYLRWLLDRFEGRLTHALAGYNAGEGTVDRYRGMPPYRETQGYVRRIFKVLGVEQGEAGEAVMVAAR